MFIIVNLAEFIKLPMFVDFLFLITNLFFDLSFNLLIILRRQAIILIIKAYFEQVKFLFKI
jgi:hypothetical protein